MAAARSCEQRGDIVAMERHLRAALQVDPEHALANADLAALESVRGRGPIGLAAVVDGVGHGPVRAGRDDPCPCGSGCRHEACCDLTDGWPFEARVRMLPSRIGEWLERPAGHRRRLGLALRAAGVERVPDDLDDPDALQDLDRIVAALHDPTLTDLHLFEGGGLEQVIAEVGPLLWPDERVALEGWVGRRHDLYRVAWRCGEAGELVSVTDDTVHAVWGLDEDRIDPGTAWVFGVLVPGPGDEELVAAMSGVAGHDADLITALLERQASAAEWAELLVGSIVAVRR